MCVCGWFLCQTSSCMLRPLYRFPFPFRVVCCSQYELFLANSWERKITNSLQKEPSMCTNYGLSLDVGVSSPWQQLAAKHIAGKQTDSHHRWLLKCHKQTRGDKLQTLNPFIFFRPESRKRDRSETRNCTCGFLVVPQQRAIFNGTTSSVVCFVHSTGHAGDVCAWSRVQEHSILSVLLPRCRLRAS